MASVKAEQSLSVNLDAEKKKIQNYGPILVVINTVAVITTTTN